MKHKYLYTLGVLFVFALITNACSKKEVVPKLIVHVQEVDETPANAAQVHAWYGPTAGQIGVSLNEPYMDQEGYTDDQGDLIFEFRYSAVLDLDVVYYKHYLDTLLNPMVDTLYGHKVVKIETVRQKSSQNIYNEIVEVK